MKCSFLLPFPTLLSFPLAVLTVLLARCTQPSVHALPASLLCLCSLLAGVFRSLDEVTFMLSPSGRVCSLSAHCNLHPHCLAWRQCLIAEPKGHPHFLPVASWQLPALPREPSFPQPGFFREVASLSKLLPAALPALLVAFFFF